MTPNEGALIILLGITIMFAIMVADQLRSKKSKHA